MTSLELLRTALLFGLTAVAEIVGCYLPWLWLRQGRSAWLLLPAALSLALFAWLLTLHPGASGRTYAAYGGAYIVVALLWLRWLDPADARLLWLRANRKPWKPICWELGISRATANRRWQYGIAVIVWRLNGKRVPSKRSIDFVISRAAQ
jgi:drug/metabolite transporter superfamily protein YnfA